MTVAFYYLMVLSNYINAFFGGEEIPVSWNPFAFPQTRKLFVHVMFVSPILNGIFAYGVQTFSRMYPAVFAKINRWLGRDERGD